MEDAAPTDQGPRTKDQGRLLTALRHRTFRSLRHRDYRLYFAGQLVSFVGSWMQSAALWWLVFDRTADPGWPPLLLVAQVGPTLLLGPLGGALADRLPKRHIVYATQCAFLANAALLTFLVAADLAHPWLLFALQLVSGVIQGIDLPARLAFVPDLVPRADLINAVGLNSLLFNSARAVGPAVAGVLFLVAGWVAEVLPGSRAVTLGAVWCFALNTLSYAAVLVALRKITVGTTKTKTAATRGSIWDGVRFLRQRPAMAGLVVLTGLFSVFGWPTLPLLPAYTRLVLGHDQDEYSLLVSGVGAGALLAALTTATFGSVARRGLFLALGAGCGAAALWGLAAVHSFPAAIGCCAALGFGLILYLSTGQSTLQLSAPDESRGRVMALWAMTLSASSLPGHLAVGGLAKVYAVPDVLTGMAVGVTAAAAGVVVLAAALQKPPRSG